MVFGDRKGPSLEGGNGSINDRCQQLTDFMQPKFPPSARLDFQVTGYVRPGKKLVDEVCVVGPRKEQSLKALGVATRGAKFTSLTAITRRRESCTRYNATCPSFSVGWEGVVMHPCQPCSGRAWLGCPSLLRSSVSSLWEVAPTVSAPCSTTPSVPMLATTNKPAAKNRPTATGHPPLPTAYWPLAMAHRIRTPS